MKHINTTRRTRQKKLLLIVAVFILTGVVLVLAYKSLHNKTASGAVKNTPTTINSGGVNYSPPTNDDKTAGDSIKKDLPSNTSTSSTPPQSTSQKTVMPTISHADSSTINAYVSGVFEDGGSCEATFTSGSKTFQKTSSGFANVSYTQCSPITLSSSDFPATGNWTVTVKYSSKTAVGTSQPRTFEVK